MKMKMMMTVLTLLLGIQAQAVASTMNAEQLEPTLDLFQVDDPPPPYNGYAYGPKRTIRWNDYGTNRIPKILTESTVIYTNGRLVNEVLLRAVNNRISVRSVRGFTIDGQVIELRQLTGDLRGNMQKRASVDRYYSVRLERIEIQATSPNLIGSRGELQVFLGLAD